MQRRRALVAKADAIGLLVTQRRAAAHQSIAGKVEAGPELTREAARLALEILEEQDPEFLALATKAEEAGRLRVAHQLLTERQEDRSAQEADKRFGRAWSDLQEIEPKFFNPNGESEKILQRLEGLSFLLRLAATVEPTPTQSPVEDHL